MIPESLSPVWEDRKESSEHARMNSPIPGGDVQRGSRLCCYQLDPTQDPRWAELVERHPKASVFHSVGWLQVLRQTYGYEPVAFTTSPPNSELKNGLVFC